jgi:hydroxyacylglutathione hydrolase
MLLAPDVALVGGAEIGEAGDPDDCNVYAVRTTAGAVLVDAGTGRSVDRIVASATRDGLLDHGIAALLLTHTHLDHSGGACALRAEFGATVYASPEAARRMEAADEEAIALPAARAAGMYRQDDHLRACHVDRTVTDGETFDIGGITFTAMATPGHARDHVVYLATLGGRRVLFAGDLLFPGGQIALINTHDCCLRELIGTLESLRGLAFDALLAGHLEPLLSGASAALDDALVTLDALAVPRSIV